MGVLGLLPTIFQENQRGKGGIHPPPPRPYGTAKSAGLRGRRNHGFTIKKKHDLKNQPFLGSSRSVVRGRANQTLKNYVLHQGK